MHILGVELSFTSTHYDLLIIRKTVAPPKSRAHSSTKRPAISRQTAKERASMLIIQSQRHRGPGPQGYKRPQRSATGTDCDGEQRRELARSSSRASGTGDQVHFIQGQQYVQGAGFCSEAGSQHRQHRRELAAHHPEPAAQGSGPLHRRPAVYPGCSTDGGQRRELACSSSIASGSPQ